MLKTRVVNIRDSRWDVYIGRPSPFGNPFVLTMKTRREEVLRKFGIWFKKKLAQDPTYKAQVHKLKGKSLGCFCAEGSSELTADDKPYVCHGQIIAEYVDGEPL